MKKFTKIIMVLCLLVLVTTAFACEKKHTHEYGEDGKCECGEVDPNFEESIKDKYDCISISEAIALANEAGQNGTSEKYYVYGKIVSISNPTYGEMTITDGVDELYVYGSTDENGTLYSEWEGDKPVAGDEVVLYGTLKTYKDTPEMDRSIIKEFKHVEVEIDESQYAEKTISEVRELEEGKLVKVTGIVSKITYAFGMKPNGFILIDETGSIYVYGDQIAQVVEEGNKVTIAGEKTYYVLSTEQDYADKHGYKGSCQIQSPILLENDKKANEFPKTGITESTVKEILDTEITENITSKVFKVNAYIKKVPGNGFTNYYINDLDGVTGSYVYTSCNGNDFSYLDEFDGKICTVYLTALNAKSTNAGCVYRFIPVLVKDEGFKFDIKDTAGHVVKYYGVDQFLSLYTGDPALELVSKVSSDVLGFKDVELKYSSSNENTIYFEVAEGKVIMHAKDSGEAVVTIESTYEGVTYSEKVTIKVSNIGDVEYTTIKEAIEAEDGTLVTVKGIVMSSLVNQTGFYLNDETGIIAIRCTSELLETIELGQMIIIKGTKSHITKDPLSTSYVGQIAISDAELLANLYGNHEYSKATFDYTKTLKDLYELDPTKDYSTSVFVVKATVEVVETAYYTNINVKSMDGKVTLGLYCSSANQYNWLKEYAGKEIELEIAMCNWNDKTYYRGCVIAATFEGVTTVNDLNFR